MRGLRMLGVAAVALAVGMFGAGASFAQDDDHTTYTQPVNALVMPFDATSGRVSFFVVSNVSGVSPTSDPDRAIPAVSTHWSYWSEDCQHLADVYACLTLNDTVVVDPTAIQSLDAGNNAYGPVVNLSGKRGFVVVSAYSTGEVCADASYEGYLPIDDALVGTYTLADIGSGAALGADAIGLGLNTDESGCSANAYQRYLDHLTPGSGFDCHTDLPDIATDAIDIQTFRPESLNLSAVVLLDLVEQAGSGPVRDIEVGPRTGGTTMNAVYYDNTETATSLPDVRVRCAEFNTLVPGDGNLIPNSVRGLSAGLFRLSHFEPEIGRGTGHFVYAVYGQAVGQFGAGANGKYRVLGSVQ